jgi:multiple sugar transport system substrate-binding protein
MKRVTRFRWRACGVVGAVACLGIVTAGCGGSSGGATTENGEPVVTVATWQDALTNGNIAQALKPLEEKDHIIVNISEMPLSDYSTKLDTLSTAKKLPDLFWIGDNNEALWGSEHVLFNWTSYAENTKTATFNLANFAPSAISAWKVNGQLDGLPSLMNTYGIFYNLNDFQKAGLAAPTTDWTYQTVYNDAAKLTSTFHTYGYWDDGNLSSPFGMGLYSVANGGAPFVNQITNPTTVGASPQFIQGTELFQEAVKKGWVPSPNVNTANVLTDFAAGKIPMMGGGQWLAATLLQDHPNFKWGFAPDPSLYSGTAYYDAVGIGSPSYLPNPSATWKVLQYLDTTGLGEAMAKEPDAPTAYVPAASAYLQALDAGGQANTAATVEAELKAAKKVPITFISPWQTQANNVVTADWNKILSSGTGSSAGAINSMLSSLRTAMQSAQ